MRSISCEICLPCGRRHLLVWMLAALGTCDLHAVESGTATSVTRPAEVVVSPREVQLVGLRAAQQLLVTGRDAEGREYDLTHAAQYQATSPAWAVSAGGLVTARSPGSGTLSIQVGDQQFQVEVQVESSGDQPPVSFKREMVPLLSARGCSDIGCHGAPSGKGGFRLSLWGSDHGFDYAQLARGAFGRRTNPLDPAASLILQKPLTRVAHIGGQRFTAGSLAAELFEQWQREGLVHDPQAPSLLELIVTPATRVLHAPAVAQQLAVTAAFDDGTRADVTRLTAFSTSDLGLAKVSQGGLVTFSQQGEVAILCRYMGQLMAVRLMHIAPPASDYEWPHPEENNFIDDYVFQKLQRLHIVPSEICSDEDFVRRIYLDLCGVLPTPAETEEFLTTEHPNKRTRLVDALFMRAEYGDLWTKKWMDVLRVSRDTIQLQGAQKFQSWLREQIVQDRPFSEVVTEMLTSDGESYSRGAVNYFCTAPMLRKVTDADYLQKDLAEATAQLFMGIRLQCAQCHNHPYERWTQDDYLGLAAFFSQVTRSRLGEAGPAGRPERRQIAVQLDPQISGLSAAENQAVRPHFPGQPAVELPAGSDYRQKLAAWLVDGSNPFFAKSMVNRVWFHLHGRGIVEPVDDFRDSNPAVNDELLNGLAEYFVTHEFRLRPLIRAIVSSRTYQASSAGSELPGAGHKYFAQHRARPLAAEILLDAICDVTGVAEQYEIMADYTIGIPTEKVTLPLGTRAVQLPVTDVVTLINTSSNYVRYELHPFLRTFGQPVRRQTCECDRSPGFSRKQALELTVGEMVSSKVADASGRVQRLIDQGASDAEMLRSFYARALCRSPSPQAERQLLAYISTSADRQQAWEDILWTILNSKEFIYQH